MTTKVEMLAAVSSSLNRYEEKEGILRDQARAEGGDAREQQLVACYGAARASYHALIDEALDEANAETGSLASQAKTVSGQIKASIDQQEAIITVTKHMTRLTKLLVKVIAL